ncbi:MAG: group II intron reverse transcriptase/maturase, partial [Sutterellaceae bacterium]|nr:group II intron reverse transcriptase/maturase [Sutterellaceae bacterium]
MAKDPGEGAGTCIRMETAEQTSTFFDAITLERILAPGNLLEALEQVERNKGAPGVDGMRTDELRDWIRSHPGQLTNAIRTGKYRPKPVKRVTIPKQEKGKFRNLGIPT